MTTVAVLTSGGLAPGLSSAVTGMVEHWMLHDPDTEVIGYRHGFAGLLTGDAIWFGPEIRRHLESLHAMGGSPLGSSRVRLTNVDDCERRGLTSAGVTPLETTARQLARDGVSVIHPIGGDDTAANAAALAAYCESIGLPITVIGLPKTIDNDIMPIARTIGSSSAARAGARFARNIVAEHSASPRTLVVHEVMGRGSGWLTARTAELHREWVRSLDRIPELLEPDSWDVHAVLVPELPFEPEHVAASLEPVWADQGCANVFISEGAGASLVMHERLGEGTAIATDAFGHPRLDRVNVGERLADELGALLDAERTLVVKSGYFARSGPADAEDRSLISHCCTTALRGALEGESGIVGDDQGADGELRVIEFDRIHGGRVLDTAAAWVQALPLVERCDR